MNQAFWFAKISGLALELNLVTKVRPMLSKPVVDNLLVVASFVL
jgi:hypothetical protein